MHSFRRRLSDVFLFLQPVAAEPTPAAEETPAPVEPEVAPVEGPVAEAEAAPVVAEEAPKEEAAPVEEPATETPAAEEKAAEKVRFIFCVVVMLGGTSQTDSKLLFSFISQTQPHATST